MSKFFRFVASLLSILLLVACGTSEDYQKSNLQSNLIGDNSPTQNSGSILSMIAFDLVGGMFSTNSQTIKNSVLSDGDSTPLSVGKVIASEKSIKAVAIDTSFSFSGAGGNGKLTLIANGNAEKIFESETSPTPQSYQFRNLNLRFLFFNYTYYHDCLGKIRVDGEISCKIIGDYNLRNENFVGKALCRNGYQEDRSTLLYMSDEANYEVSLETLLEIEGNPFNFSSYYYSGQITIDGVINEIETLLSANNTCQK